MKRLVTVLLGVILLGVAVVLPAAPAAAEEVRTEVTWNRYQVEQKAKQFGWTSTACAVLGVGFAANDVAARRAEVTLVRGVGYAALAVATACALDHFFVQSSGAANIFKGAASQGMCVRQTNVINSTSTYSWDKGRTYYQAVRC